MRFPSRPIMSICSSVIYSSCAMFVDSTPPMTVKTMALLFKNNQKTAFSQLTTSSSV